MNSIGKNQSIVGTGGDDDSPPSNSADLLRLDINGSSGYLFDANYVSTDTSGEYHTFSLFYSPSSPPNFEAVPETYSIELNATHWDSGGSLVDAPTIQAMSVRLLDVNEVPDIVSSENPIQRTIFEDQNTSQIIGFTPMEISAYDPEGSLIKWSYTTDNTLWQGTVKLKGSNGVATYLAPGVDSGLYNSAELIEIQYSSPADSFGSENLTFVAKDTSGFVSSSVTVNMTLDPVHDDPITLGLSTPVSLAYAEEGTAFVIDLNPTDPDSAANPALRPDNNVSASPSPPGYAGAQIFYTLTGADADKFQVSSNGQLSFVSPPDYENPTDVGGGLNNNVYEVTVNVRDQSDASLANSDSQNLTITVTPINELPTLNGGVYDFNITVDEDQTWNWDPNDFTHPNLIASDVDAGHQANLTWTVKPGSGGVLGTASVSGTGVTPNFLTYLTKQDLQGDGNVLTKDVFVPELSDVNGTGVGTTLAIHQSG